MKIILFISILIQTSYEFENLLPNNNTTCLYKVYSLFSEYNSLIIYNNNEYIDDIFNTNTTKFVFTINKYPNALYSSDKMNLFFFYISNIQELKCIYKTLYKYRIWNSRAKFLIYFTKQINLNEVFKLSWEYYVYNIIVLENELIYTYYPYLNSNCGKNITSIFLVNCKEVNQHNLYPEKVPLNLFGCPVTLSALILYPLVINASLDRAIPSSAGLEVTIMHNIAQWLNFSENYSEIANEWWGVKLPNGTYTKGYGRLVRREVDIMFGFGHAEYFTSYDIDSTVCHYIDITNFWVPLAGEAPKWKKILSIFNMSLWFTIFIALIIHGILWRIISQNTEINNFRSFVNCFMNAWCILLQSTTSKPKNSSLRISYFLWCMMSLTLYTAYNSKLVSFLTTPTYDRQINSLKEILKSDLTIGLFPEDYIYFHENDPYEKIILKTYQTCHDFYRCIDQMAYYKNYSIFINKSIMKFFNHKYEMSDGESLVFEVHEYEIIEILRYNMVKGFPLLDRINWLLISMTETGFIRKWMNDVEISSNNNLNNRKRLPLSLQHMQTAFYILFIGLSFSMLAFVIEVILNKFYKKRRNYFK